MDNSIFFIFISRALCSSPLPSSSFSLFLFSFFLSFSSSIFLYLFFIPSFSIFSLFRALTHNGQIVMYYLQKHQTDGFYPFVSFCVHFTIACLLPIAINSTKHSSLRCVRVNLSYKRMNRYNATCSEFIMLSGYASHSF